MAEDFAILSQEGKKGATVYKVLLHKNGDHSRDPIAAAKLKDVDLAANGDEIRTYNLRVLCPDGSAIERSFPVSTPNIAVPVNATPDQIKAYNDALRKQNEQDGEWIRGELVELYRQCSEWPRPGAGVPDRPHENYEFDCNKAIECWCGQKHCYHGH